MGGRAKDMFRVFFAGGGTGGHLFPGLSLAQAIKVLLPDSEITFVVSGKRLDSSLIENRGFNFVRIEQRYLPRDPRRMGQFMVTNVRAFWQASRLIVRRRPDVVVGLGGYASFAAAAASLLAGVPVVLLEQNVIPGKANRALALAADRVFCQWPGSARYFLRRDNLTFAGSPVRESLKPEYKVSKEIAREKLALSPERRTLLVLGGSQGASAVNNAMLGALPEIEEFRDRIQIIHLAGRAHAPSVRATYRQAGICGKVYGFCEQMQLIYCAADLAFCRAGGTTIAEITAMGLPSVLVPLPNAAANHQLANARALACTGAARLLQQKYLTAQVVRRVVFDLLLDEVELACMARRSFLMGRPAAAARIAREIAEKYMNSHVSLTAEAQRGEAASLAASPAAC